MRFCLHLSRNFKVFFFLQHESEVTLHLTSIIPQKTFCEWNKLKKKHFYVQGNPHIFKEFQNLDGNTLQGFQIILLMCIQASILKTP